MIQHLFNITTPFYTILYTTISSHFFRKHEPTQIALQSRYTFLSVMDLLKSLMREISVCLLILVLFSRETLAADDKDKQECTEVLVGLATCLPYVGGTAKAPTPDCCTGLKQVLNTNKKCLCLVIKDRNDPDLGLTINVTLALGLPTVCNAPADVTKCPALLHLDPNSTDAQVFYQNGHNASGSASSPAPSVNANLTSIRGSGGGRTGSSSGTGIRKRSLTWKVIVSGVLLWFFTSDLVI